MLNRQFTKRTQGFNQKMQKKKHFKNKVDLQFYYENITMKLT